MPEQNKSNSKGSSSLPPSVFDKLLELGIAAGNTLDVDEPLLKMPGNLPKK